MPERSAIARRYTDIERISHDDFLRLEGLLTIGRDLQAQLDQATRSGAAITGEKEEGGHYYGVTSDAFSEGFGARELCRKLEIEIEEPGGS